MTDKQNQETLKLDPVKEEVGTKLQQVLQLLIEVQATRIDGDLPYSANKAIANIVRNPPEYTAMVDHLLDKTGELIDYINNGEIN
ncbi:MAG: hypothetical protein RLZZ507_3613 [Cyanobacteriota bacterium]|jgi:hypothetical protein